MIRKLIGVVLLLVGAFLLFGAAADAWDREQWRQAAVEIDALVLPREAGAKLGQSMPALAGAETVVRMGALRAVYAALDTGLATTPPSGDRITVLIDPQQQDKAVLNDPLAIWSNQLESGGIAVLLVLVGLFMMRSRGRRPAMTMTGGAAMTIATALRQAASRQVGVQQAGARADARTATRAASASATAARSAATAKPARFTSATVTSTVVQRMRDSAVTVHRAGGPSVVRTIERPSGALPILVFGVIVVVLVVTLVAG
jgi:hypothetical protein